MVRPEDAIRICQTLSIHNIPFWLTGGWGIDALLREPTRPHKDLDLLMLLDDVVRMRELLGRDGFGLKELWSENRWIVDGQGIETPTAFVLQDPEGREVDAHALRFDDQGNGIPTWADDRGIVFGKEALAGEGAIAGFAVRCLSPEMQVLCHTGYALPGVQVRDMERLCERFGVKLPSEHPRPRRPGT
jgi:lincosamide nucleotidyltransferase A/C/D/E